MSQLTLSKLPALLADLHVVHGDLTVELRKADTCWPFRLRAGHVSIEGRGKACRPRFVANHRHEPHGRLEPSCRGGDGAGE